MAKKYFLPLLVFITVLSLALRLIDYDRIPPFGETNDEFMYPFAGISLLKTGVMTSWSPFIAYKDSYSLTLWGQNFRMVTPWFDKPPLYPLLAGTASLAAGEDEFHKVQIKTFRLIPIALSMATIFLVGLVASSYFGPSVGIMAAVLYATIPTIVLGNRLGLTENLLTPLTLLGLWLFNQFRITKRPSLLVMLGIVCGLTVATKQIGITLPIALVLFFAMRREWRNVFVLSVFTIPFALINPLMGYFSDWQMYQGAMREFNQAHSLGLPELVVTLFRTPGIGHKESIFLDGAMLAGFILLFSGPFWLKLDNQKRLSLLAYPFIYLTALVLLEGGQTWYGWHLFPLYPFLTILLARGLTVLFEELNVFQFLFFFITIASSSLRFLILIYDLSPRIWQNILVLILVICGGTFIVNNKRYTRTMLAIVFILLITVNIVAILFLSQIYPARPQPLL